MCWRVERVRKLPFRQTHTNRRPSPSAAFSWPAFPAAVHRATTIAPMRLVLTRRACPHWIDAGYPRFRATLCAPIWWPRNPIGGSKFGAGHRAAGNGTKNRREPLRWKKWHRPFLRATTPPKTAPRIPASHRAAGNGTKFGRVAAVTRHTGSLKAGSLWHGGCHR